MPSREVEQAPPALNCAVQHREHTDKCGELAGGQWTPLLHHQMSDRFGLSFAHREVLRPPEALTKQRAPPFESGSVEGKRHDHQESSDNGQGVGGAVSQQESPIQLHVLEN